MKKIEMLDTNICYMCHVLNPLHLPLLKKIGKLDKSTDRKKIAFLKFTLHVYDFIYLKSVHPVFNNLHKILRAYIYSISKEEVIIK